MINLYQKFNKEINRLNNWSLITRIYKKKKINLNKN